MEYFPTLNRPTANLAGMDARSTAQKRRSRRSNLWMAASVEHGGDRIEVVLRNLSADGALIQGDHAMAVDDEVLFHKNELAVSGRIAWVEGRRAGISFAKCLDPETVLRHVPAPKPVKAECHKRPGFRGRLSPEDRRFAESFWGGRLPSIE